MSYFCRHYKGGIYEVLAYDAEHTHTHETLVVYRAVTTGSIWARPYKEFFGTVTLEDGRRAKRFARVSLEDLSAAYEAKRAAA